MQMAKILNKSFLTSCMSCRDTFLTSPLDISPFSIPTNPKNLTASGYFDKRTIAVSGDRSSQKTQAKLMNTSTLVDHKTKKQQPTEKETHQITNCKKK